MFLKIKIIDKKFDGTWNESHTLENGADYEITPQVGDSIEVMVPRLVDSEGRMVAGKDYLGPVWTAEHALVIQRSWGLSEFSSAFQKDGETITSHIHGCTVTAQIEWKSTTRKSGK